MNFFESDQLWFINNRLLEGAEGTAYTFMSTKDMLNFYMNSMLYKVCSPLMTATFAMTAAYDIYLYRKNKQLLNFLRYEYERNNEPTASQREGLKKLNQNFGRFDLQSVDLRGLTEVFQKEVNLQGVSVVFSSLSAGTMLVYLVGFALKEAGTKLAAFFFLPLAAIGLMAIRFGYGLYENYQIMKSAPTERPDVGVKYKQEMIKNAIGLFVSIISLVVFSGVMLSPVAPLAMLLLSFTIVLMRSGSFLWNSLKESECTLAWTKRFKSFLGLGKEMYKAESSEPAKNTESMPQISGTPGSFVGG